MGIPDTRSVITNPGQPLETIWPYIDVIADAALWKPPVCTNLFQCSTDTAAVSDFTSILQGGKPIVIALYISDVFLFPGQWTLTDGEVILPDDTTQLTHVEDMQSLLLGQLIYKMLNTSYSEIHGDTKKVENFIEMLMKSEFFVLKEIC